MKTRTLQEVKTDINKKCLTCVWGKDVGGKIFCMFSKCVNGDKKRL